MPNPGSKSHCGVITNDAPVQNGHLPNQSFIVIFDLAISQISEERLEVTENLTRRFLLIDNNERQGTTRHCTEDC